MLRFHMLLVTLGLAALSLASRDGVADTYQETTLGGTTPPYWEFSLRFKTDSSDQGPATGRPALLRASMMDDRTFVIFADPAEISAFIKRQC